MSVDLCQERDVQSTVENFCRMVHYQPLSDIEKKILDFLEACILADFHVISVIRSNVDSGFHRRCHNSHQINNLVFFASTPIISSVRCNFCRKFLRLFSRYRWSEICILWNSNLDLWIYVLSPRNGFPMLAEHEASLPRNGFPMPADWVFSFYHSWDWDFGFESQPRNGFPMLAEVELSHPSSFFSGRSTHSSSAVGLSSSSGGFLLPSPSVFV